MPRYKGEFAENSSCQDDSWPCCGTGAVLVEGKVKWWNGLELVFLNVLVSRS